jgi:hypothetical protein
MTALIEERIASLPALAVARIAALPGKGNKFIGIRSLNAASIS